MTIEGWVLEHYQWAFVVGALGTLTLAGLAIHERLKPTRDVDKLEPRIIELRRDGVFSKAERVVRAARTDGWSVLHQDRNECCALLRALCNAARHVPNPRAWAVCLDGSEWEIISEFLNLVKPLVLVLRLTPLEIVGDAKFYNSHKRNSARELYKAMRCRFPSRLSRLSQA